MNPQEVTTALAGIRESVITKMTADNARLDALEQKLVAGGGLRTAAQPPMLDLEPLTKSDSLEPFRTKKTDRSDHIALGFSVKALVNAGASGTSTDNMYPTQAQRLARLHGFALRPLRLLDVLPSQPVTSRKVEFVRMDWDGEADVQSVEGEEKAEVDFEPTLVEVEIATVALHATLSSQVIEDNSMLLAEIERIMGHDVLSKVEKELLTGSGTGGHVDGIYTQAPAIATSEAGVPERIGQALTAMETAGYTPNVILMHPTTWFGISIQKDAEGRFLYGNPASPAQPTLFNRPVVTTPTIPIERALIGDTAQAVVLDRMAPTVFLSRDHKDYRTRNLVLVLIETRVAVAVRDVQAWRRVFLDPISD